MGEGIRGKENIASTDHYDKAQYCKDNSKHDPLRLLALDRGGNAPVAIDLRQHERQNQAKEQQGLRK